MITSLICTFLFPGIQKINLNNHLEQLFSLLVLLWVYGQDNNSEPNMAPVNFYGQLFCQITQKISVKRLVSIVKVLIMCTVPPRILWQCLTCTYRVLLDFACNGGGTRLREWFYPVLNKKQFAGYYLSGVLHTTVCKMKHFTGNRGLMWVNYRWIWYTVTSWKAVKNKSVLGLKFVWLPNINCFL